MHLAVLKFVRQEKQKQKKSMKEGGREEEEEEGLHFLGFYKAKLKS